MLIILINYLYQQNLYFYYVERGILEFNILALDILKFVLPTRFLYNIFQQIII